MARYRSPVQRGYCTSELERFYRGTCHRTPDTFNRTIVQLMLYKTMNHTTTPTTSREFDELLTEQKLAYQVLVQGRPKQERSGAVTKSLDNGLGLNSDSTPDTLEAMTEQNEQMLSLGHAVEQPKVR